MAPPPRSHLTSSTSLLAPTTQLSHQIRQCRPDLPADTGTKEKRASISAESGTDTGESDADTSSTNNTGNDEHQSDNEHGDEGILFFIVIVSLYINFL